MRTNWRFFLTAGDNDPARRGIEFYKQMVKTAKRSWLLPDLAETKRYTPRSRLEFSMYGSLTI